MFVTGGNKVDALRNVRIAVEIKALLNVRELYPASRTSNLFIATSREQCKTCNTYLENDYHDSALLDRGDGETCSDNSPSALKKRSLRQHTISLTVLNAIIAI